MRTLIFVLVVVSVIKNSQGYSCGWIWSSWSSWSHTQCIGFCGWPSSWNEECSRTCLDWSYCDNVSWRHCRNVNCHSGIYNSDLNKCFCSIGFSGKCCEKVCLWTNWGNWGTCSGTGSDRERHRNRVSTCQVSPSAADQTRTQSDRCPGQCENGGTLIGNTCTCRPGTSGSWCETLCVWSEWKDWTVCNANCGGGTRSRSRQSNCEVSPTEDQEYRQSEICTGSCQHGGTYVEYQCSCRPGFSGTCCQEICTWTRWSTWDQCDGVCGGGSRHRTRTSNCPVSTDDDQRNKDSIPCTGHCDHDGTYTGTMCDCSPGYGGTCCEYEIDECISDPCQRGGTCTDMLNRYKCKCPPKAYGNNCEQDICQPKPSDIVFVLDSSVSMTETDFRKQLDFISQFVDRLVIGPRDFQMSVITFSFESKIEFYLGEHNTNVSMKQALEAVEYRPGATFTHKGLESVKDVLLYEMRNSRRPTTLSWTPFTYVFVLTDGMSNKRQATKKVAVELRHVADTIVAIGIGPEVSHRELLDIASSGDKQKAQYVFSVDNFNALYTITQELIRGDCQKCSSSHLADIVILLDDSSYIDKQEFQTAIDDISYIINNAEAYGADMGPQIGLVKFSGITKTLLKLNHGKDKELLLPFVQTLVQNDKVCQQKTECNENISIAMNKIIQEEFLEKNGGRKNARRFLVVMTDGHFESFNEKEGKTLANGWNSEDVSIIAIGLNDAVNMEGLLSLVDDTNKVILTDYHTVPTILDAMIGEFTYTVCKLV